MTGQVDEIKARLDIVDIVSEYVQLKQAGTNWKAPCPFHNEKTPSFMASRDKQIWHCFGCNEGGDIISFVQKIEGLEFLDALQLLAKKAGVTLERRTGDNETSSKKARLGLICRYAAEYWHQVLLHETHGKTARDYLHERGITDETIKEFKIGFAVESWDALQKFLLSKKFTDQEIYLAGLLVKKDRGAGFYDRFRNRVMFPINDTHGNPVGFTGRTLSTGETAGAKYVNTPQTDLYNKSIVVFNLDKAKTAIRKEDVAVLVEGQMDVISSYQAGVQNVVAVSGTALTPEQVKLIKRFSSNIAIALDADAAGKQAVDRSAEVIAKSDAQTTQALDRYGNVRTYVATAGEQDVNIKVIVLPEDVKDPDELIQKDFNMWRQAITSAKPVMQYYLDRTSSEFDLTTAEGKKKATVFFLSMVSKLANRVEQTHWIQKLAGLVNVDERVLWEALPQGAPLEPRSKISEPVAQASTQKNTGVVQKLEDELIGIGLKFPEYLSKLEEKLEFEMIQDPDLQSLYKQLVFYYTSTVERETDKFDYQQFHSRVDTPELQKLAHKLVLQTEEGFSDFTSAEIERAFQSSLARHRIVTLHAKRNEIARKLQQAEQQDQQEQVEQLLGQLTQLNTQINQLDS